MQAVAVITVIDGVILFHARAAAIVSKFRCKLVCCSFFMALLSRSAHFPAVDCLEDRYAEMIGAK